MPTLQTYIHIGYPKNASTTLQMDVFPNIKDALYLGKTYDTEHSFFSKEITELIYSMAMMDTIDCSYEGIREKITEVLKKANKNKLIISSEAFTNNFADRGVMAKRLYSVFPDARILMVIRNQMDSLLSMYGFLVCQRGENVNVSYGRPSIDSMEQWILDQEKFIGRSYITTLNYSKLISEYIRLFGEKNITILLFEELVNNSDEFFYKIDEFFDVEIKSDSSNKVRVIPKRNKKPSNRELFYYKLRNKFPAGEFSKYIPKLIINIWRNYLSAGSSKREIDDLPLEMRNRHVLMYAEDNRRLQKILDINLKQYGYDV